MKLPKLILISIFSLFLLQAALAQRIGDPAPDFSLVNKQGQLVTLADFQGKPLVLNVWATWCPFCVEELPLFQRIQDELQGRSTEPEATILIVNNNESPAAAIRYLDEVVKVNLPAVFDATRDQRAQLSAEGVKLDSTVDVLKRYRVRGMPTTFFIDSTGVIQGIKVGLLTELEASQLLAQIGVEWLP